MSQHPSFTALALAILKDLREIKETIKKQAHSSTYAGEASNKKQQSNPEVIVRTLRNDKLIVETQPNDPKGQSTQTWINRGTWAAVAAASIYACIAAFMYVEMRKSTDAAASAARTAKEGLDFTKFIEEPFISLESVTPSDFPEGKNPSFVLTFRNNGRNLAVNVAGNVTMTSAGLNFPISELTPLDRKGNFMLGTIPGGSTGTRWIAVVDQGPFRQYKARIKAGTTRFYVRGFIRWEDASGNKFPDRPFCLFYNPEPGRPTTIGILDFCPPEQEQKAN